MGLFFIANQGDMQKWKDPFITMHSLVSFIT